MNAFRSAFAMLPRSGTGRTTSLNPNAATRNFLLPLRKPFAVTAPPSLSPLLSFRYNLSSTFASSSSPPMADAGALDPLDGVLETQFETFRTLLYDSSNLRERLKSVAMELDSTNRIIHADLLLVHQPRPINEVLLKPKSQIGVQKDLFNKLAEILRECPGQYYRYQNEWRSETQTVVSLLAFMHWLETGSLLLHPEAQEKLGLTSPDFGLDIEDYLVGICFMSNELPRYVVNRVTYGDYDSPRKVLNFLTDLHAAFRMLNLRNDFLRKKFDGMKYDLKRVEEVYYDVKIRGLTQNEDSKGDQGVEGEA